jgi:DNA-binding MarR family transcriptional regulator
MVSFDRIHRETGLPRYSVSRAATFLEDQGLGKIKQDKNDRRWKRLHITALGLKCCERIDSLTCQFLMMRFREDGKTFRRKDLFPYYSFASPIYSAARCLPDPLQVLGPWKFPDPITDDSNLTAQQKALIHYLDEVQRAAKGLERRRQSFSAVGHRMVASKERSLRSKGEHASRGVGSKAGRT